jgi:hypothetical protein
MKRGETFVAFVEKSLDGTVGTITLNSLGVSNAEPAA